MDKGLKEIELIAFPGAPNLPIFVAEKMGFFSDEDLQVNLTTTTSSPYQRENLVEGKYQIAGTAIDNVIAYQEGQGAVEL
ncbi:MAG: ABC transporter substrate-binding protein, partial [Desulfobulbia bacterium]